MGHPDIMCGCVCVAAEERWCGVHGARPAAFLPPPGPQILPPVPDTNTGAPEDILHQRQVCGHRYSLISQPSQIARGFGAVVRHSTADPGIASSNPPQSYNIY